jgi:hypothetical protein
MESAKFSLSIRSTAHFDKFYDRYFCHLWYNVRVSLIDELRAVYYDSEWTLLYPVTLHVEADPVDFKISLLRRVSSISELPTTTIPEFIPFNDWLIANLTKNNPEYAQ